jgi:chemotaxis protein CheD
MGTNVAAGGEVFMPAPQNRLGFYLRPGFLYASIEPASITTILGSCVCVCLWDSVTRIGGANHFLLPNGSTRDGLFRFGEHAIPGLIERLITFGAKRRHLKAKVFGGACVGPRTASEDHLGAKNASFAIAFLRREGISVVSTDTTGERGRKLVFNTDDGTAFVKYL